MFNNGLMQFETNIGTQFINIVSQKYNFKKSDLSRFDYLDNYVETPILNNDETINYDKKELNSQRSLERMR